MNRLNAESSLYLRQHADNPVCWQPWDEAALAEARELRRPILLSIGYSACHWCHVMAHESFEHEETARVMNELYVNIKVDREERPDLDRIYQLSHQLLTGRGGGWPLTVFLDPAEQIPFFAGTYFPRDPRYGMPAFSDILRRAREWYDENHEEVEGQSQKLRDAINSIQRPGTKNSDPLADTAGLMIEEASKRILSQYDEQHGGFGSAPKFPQAPLLNAIRKISLDGSGLAGQLSTPLESTLESMATSGLRDHLDGGFFRYCVDESWTIPHFEKMLYDNAQLLPLFAEAARRGESPLLQTAAEGISAWLESTMRVASGGYAASIDADADGREGGFHVWRKEEVRGLLPGASYRLFEMAYGLDNPPNFEGQAWHLVRHRSDAEIAAACGLPEEQVRQQLADSERRLAASRAGRVHPTLDPKRLTSWNALLAEGYLSAGRAFERTGWLNFADEIIDFIEQEMWTGEQLLSVCHGTAARFAAYLDDYSYLLSALMQSIRIRWNTQHLEFAIGVADALLDRFEDREHGGFYFSDSAVEVPITRSMVFQDDATPAGNAIAVVALQRLGHLLGEARYLEAADRCLERGMPQIRDNPAAFASLLVAVLESAWPRPHIIMSGTDLEQKFALKRWVEDRYRVDCYLPEHHGRPLPGVLESYRSEEPVTIWLCHGMRCMPPTGSREELGQQLAEHKRKAGIQ